MRLRSKRKSIRGSTKLRLLKRGGMQVYAVYLMLGFIILFSIALVSNDRFSKYKDKTAVPLTYTCCDSGDGEACAPVPGTSIFYKGVKAGPSDPPDEYQLLKSNVYLRSQDHHIDPDPRGMLAPDGGRIFYNPRSELNKRDWAPECISNVSHPEKTSYDDFIYGPPPLGQGAPPEGASGWCYAIPNEELIYVCRKENAPGECESKSGHAKFDVYYRIKDLPVHGIHDVIKNCVKPTVVPTGGTGQNIVDVPNPSGKPNLQLETFTIIDSPPAADWISPYCKPAIYLYPTEESEVVVRIKPQGKLTYTIPQYVESGWKVIAYPNGEIIHNHLPYDYLYYEAEIPDKNFAVPDTGFVYTYDELATALPRLVTQMGLNKKETEQFAQYWLGVLPKSPYYAVKIIPQTTLDRVSPLYFSPEPTNVLRVTLHFEPLQNPLTLTEPEIPSFHRSGFTVVEWGGIFKRDKDHDFSCFM